MWKHYSRDVQKKQPRIPELVLILATAPRYSVLHIQTENTQLGFGLCEKTSQAVWHRIGQRENTADHADL